MSELGAPLPSPYPPTALTLPTPPPGKPVPESDPFELQ